MFANTVRNNAKLIAGSTAFTGGWLMAQQATPAQNADSTSTLLGEILSTVKSIESDLGITAKPTKQVDPVANFPLFTAKHGSLMAKTLQDKPELYSLCCNRVTVNGFTFDQAIQAGMDATHLILGIAAGDEESYEVFAPVMDPVIEAYHGYPPDAKHKLDIDPSHITMTVEQEKKFDEHVISTRIRAGRSLRTLPLPPGTDRAGRRTVERLLKTALTNLTGELAGKYYPLGGMTPAEEKQMQDDHFLFQKPSPRNVLANCGAARDWPDARGIFHNNDKTFLAWVNEEDHMRVISMQMGGNVKETFARFAKGVVEVEKSVGKSGYEFMYNDHLGNICTCPSNLGTGLRASVMLKLPKLYKAWGIHKLEKYCDDIGLQARGSKGEHSPPGSLGEFDISNKRRIGFSEAELIQQMIDGVDELIKLEEAL